MQASLSIRSGLFRFHSVESPRGIVLPWEVLSYARDYEIAVSQGGWFDLSDWQAVRLIGPDARDFLQRMSTLDFRKFSTGEIRQGAFLTGRGQIVAFGWFLALPEGFEFWTSAGQASVAQEHIETFHFAESFESSIATDVALVALWNVSDEARSALTANARSWKDDKRPMWWVRLLEQDAVSWMERSQNSGTQILGRRLFDFFRIAAGGPEMNAEVDATTLILEANLETAVARQKGCYPGQEVVERIFTYGSVNRKLLTVEIEASALPPLPIVVKADGKEAGVVVSVARNPHDERKAFGLGYIHRLFWARRDPFETGGDLIVRLCHTNLETSHAT